MNRDLFIFIAFCVFMLLAGMRLKQRFGDKQRRNAEKIAKNQRSKIAKMSEDPEMRRKRENREKRIRRFTILQMIVLFGLILFMIPALVRDLLLVSDIDIPNIFLRCIIFIFSIYIFILSYVKVFGKHSKTQED